MSSTLNRRDFLKTSAAALSIGLGGVEPVRRDEEDRDRHRDAREIGREAEPAGHRHRAATTARCSAPWDRAAFTDLVHAAFERGVTYIDTAHNYQTHGMIKEAIRGLPREKLYIQTKMPWDRAPFTENPTAALDRFRQELGVDYIDSVLIHCALKHTWPTDLRFMQDAFSEAQSKGAIKIKGVSCHGLPGADRGHDQRLDRRPPGARQRAGASHGRRGRRLRRAGQSRRGDERADGDARARPRDHRHEAGRQRRLHRRRGPREGDDASSSPVAASMPSSSA